MDAPDPMPNIVLALKDRLRAERGALEDMAEAALAHIDERHKCAMRRRGE